MKKSILNIGTALNKTEQKEVLGGFELPGLCLAEPGQRCDTDSDCCYSGGRCMILPSGHPSGQHYDHLPICV